jgi:quercetin dioxygenase-like cupin family protein
MTPLKLAALAAAVLAAAPALAQAPAPVPARLAPVEAPPAKPTAKVDLGADFPALAGYEFAQQTVTIPPGTGRAMHSHKGNPEIVRVLQGVLTESHNGGAPAQYPAGSTMINDGTVSHMWANLGTETVVTLNTHVRPAAPPK